MVSTAQLARHVVMIVLHGLMVLGSQALQQQAAGHASFAEGRASFSFGVCGLEGLVQVAPSMWVASLVLIRIVILSCVGQFASSYDTTVRGPCCFLVFCLQAGAAVCILVAATTATYQECMPPYISCYKLCNSDWVLLQSQHLLTLMCL